jgi:hypothetical protein
MLFNVLRKRALAVDNSNNTSDIRYVPQDIGGEYLT